MQLLRQLEKYTQVEKHKRIKTKNQNKTKTKQHILVMGPELNFNQWWEAQLVSRPTQHECLQENPTEPQAQKHSPQVWNST